MFKHLKQLIHTIALAFYIFWEAIKLELKLQLKQEIRQIQLILSDLKAPKILLDSTEKLYKFVESENFYIYVMYRIVQAYTYMVLFVWIPQGYPHKGLYGKICFIGSIPFFQWASVFKIMDIEMLDLAYDLLIIWIYF